MKTEIKKSFQHGFVLNEQELTRIYDTISQQFGKIENTSNFTTCIEIKFKDGALTETNTIKEVIYLENFGSKSIIRVTITLSYKTENSDYEVIIKFINPIYDSDTKYSVTYLVKGNDRDWVFITCSMIDERISKIKIFAPGTIFNLKTLLLSILFIGLVSMLFIFSSAQFSSDVYLERGMIDKLQREWEAKEINDPIQVILTIEKLKLERYAKISKFNPTIMIIYLLCFFIITAIPTKMTQTISSTLPIYNFCWGDYVESYRRRKTVIYIIFIVVILGLLVSIVSNLVVKKWGL